jgi:argininosuccinate lyase
VRNGLEFREAHQVVGTMVSDLESKHLIFQDLSLEDFKNYSQIFNEDIFEHLKIEHSVNMKKSEGSTSEKSVMKMINDGKEFINNMNKKD